MVRRRKVYKQRGYSNRAKDRQRKAKKVGRRRSKSGRMYTETRANRSDRNRRKRL